MSMRCARDLIAIEPGRLSKNSTPPEGVACLKYAVV